MTAPQIPLRPAGATPAGGAPPRTWRIELPAGMDLLNANHRLHWAKKARTTRAIRFAACCIARSNLVPQLERAHVEGVYEPPDRRRRDPANLYPSFKAAIDGALVDAGVLPDDDDAAPGRPGHAPWPRAPGRAAGAHRDRTGGAVKPYFEDGQVTLYLGDCRDLIPALGLTAHLVVADLGGGGA